SPPPPGIVAEDHVAAGAKRRRLVEPHRLEVRAQLLIGDPPIPEVHPTEEGDVAFHAATLPGAALLLGFPFSHPHLALGNPEFAPSLAEPPRRLDYLDVVGLAKRHARFAVGDVARRVPARLVDQLNSGTDRDVEDEARDVDAVGGPPLRPGSKFTPRVP